MGLIHETRAERIIRKADVTFHIHENVCVYSSWHERNVHLLPTTAKWCVKYLNVFRETDDTTHHYDT